MLPRRNANILIIKENLYTKMYLYGYINWVGVVAALYAVLVHLGIMYVRCHLIIYIEKETSQALRTSSSLIMKTRSGHNKMHGLQNCILVVDGFLTFLSVYVCVCVFLHPPHLQTTSAQPGK